MAEDEASMTEPLHVSVARALGWVDVAEAPASPFGTSWVGKPPAGSGLFVTKVDREARSITLDVNWGSIPRYDTDWSACGPLLERFKIETTFTPHKGGPEEWTATAWLPPREPQEVKRIYGPTPLIAVCNLLLALHKEGKLNAA